MIIIKYKLFQEARLSDILNIKGDDSELLSYIKDIKDKEFDMSRNLIKQVVLENKSINRMPIIFKINWNDTPSHSFKDRIRDRTTFKSITEFNDYFKSIVNKIFPSMISKDILSSGRYSIYLKEYNISIIINFDMDSYINKKYILNVITILPGRKGNNIIKFIDI